MLLFFITCISFFLFLKSIIIKPLPSWASKMRLLLPLLFSQELLSVRAISKLFRSRFWIGFVCQMKKSLMMTSSRIENVEDSHDMSVLDLPELALDCILERLPPAALCRMTAVCRSLRERCVSDHLWESHMRQKWGGVIGPAAFREWKWHVASKRNVGGLKHGRQRGLMRFMSLRWPLQWMTRPKVDVNNNSSQKQRSSLPFDFGSVMNWYLALESGKFWFPAQVYNRENGHIGFMLSCYDAELSYDPRTDTFQARYPPHGRRADAGECGIPWERVRAPPIDTSPHDLHVSECLNDLYPGDHIEIQWRRNKDFPYGWWYGVVGHLESCNGSENYCRCDSSDTVVLEFNHYTPGSRWRQTNVNRKDHREEGNEANGFYGGIRKIKSEAEIAIWKRLWPSEVLD